MRVIFVDGSQLVGKSTLVEGLSSKYGIECYKFPFSEYTSSLNLSSKEELRGFQAGKDLSALYWLKQLSDCNKTILVDRGPLSTAYYSLALDRMSSYQTEKFIEEVSKLSENFTYIFITAKNSPENLKRNKKDGFDGLKDVECKPGVFSFLKHLSNKFNLDFHHFENDFSTSVEENVDRFYNLINFNGEEL